MNLTAETDSPKSVDTSSSPNVSTLQSFLRSVLLGKTEQIDFVIACLLSGGHLLLDDLPGTGKTTLAKAIAEGIDGRLARVQCTPDLMPADITGFNMFNQKTREFEFHPGPVFADVLLADELNRTTPRTQSALLEAMAEQQVTIDGNHSICHPHSLSSQHKIRLIHTERTLYPKPNLIVLRSNCG